MELFNPNSNVDFMGARRWTGIFSAVLIAVSLSILAVKGLHWGLDFTGGTQIEVGYKDAADLPDIRTRLAKGGFPDAQVVSYGTSKDVLISIATRENMNQSDIEKGVVAALPNATVKRNEFIGAQVGEEMATKGILAIIVSMLATMIYIAMRFEYRFAISSAVALIHDPLVILGIFAYFQIEFDLKALAAILAVIGYSLNDTIVVFDRVRENFRKMRKSNVVDIMNSSINQTLSRTIMTSALTLVVVIALFVYGGQTVYSFALALMIGIIIGTYSSIYIAGTLALAMGLQRADLLPNERQIADERP